MNPLNLISVKFGISVRLTIFWACTIGALATVGAYYFLPSHREGIKFAGTAITAAGGIYAAYYISATLRLSQERRRQESAYRFLEYLNQNDWVDVRIALDKASNEKQGREEQFKLIESNPELRQQVYRLLGLFEDMAIAIKTGYADEQTLKLALREMACKYYSGFSPYILESRAVDKCANLYSEFESLKNAWSQNKSLYEP